MKTNLLRRRRAARIFAVSLATATVILAGPLAARSHAGVYSATECSVGNPFSAAAPGEYGHHFFGLARDCTPGGGGLSISLPQAYPAWGFGRWTVSAPAGTHIVTVSGVQAGVNADNWNVELHACTPADCGPNIYVSGDGYWRPFGSPPGNYSNWWIQLGCGAGTCNGSTAAGAHVRDVTMMMSDDSPPMVRFGEASELLDAEAQRGVGHLHLVPMDAGAGLTAASVLVNDQEVARQTYGCGGAPMQPCPASGGTLNFALDTQGSPFHDGLNSVQACAADYGAPPNLSCTESRTVRVDNSCTPSGVAGGTNLSVAFAGNRKDTVRVRPGQGALLTGQLTDQSGDPVERASLCVKEGVPGMGLSDVGTVRTDAEGRYRYGVTPGPNRHLEVGYRYNRRQLQRDASFFSPVRPRLKLWPKHRTRNGKALRLYGSIPGPANDERVVILQARYPHSRRWNTFAKARTDAHGRYQTSYRFKATFTTTTYEMRTVVPAQNGYPYTGGASRSQKIRVLGG